MKNKFNTIIARAARTAALLCVLCVFAFLPARAQTTATFSSNCITGPVLCTTINSNLIGTQFYTNRVWQGRHIGIGVSFVGGSATNTGSVGFQFGVVTGGTKAIGSTTRPFQFTSTANGTTAVNDWFVLPNYTLGPADAVVLLGITNATVNVNATYGSAGSVTVSNVWLQTDTRP